MDSKSNKHLSDALREYEAGQDPEERADDTETLSQWNLQHNNQHKLLYKKIEALFDEARVPQGDALASLAKIPALVEELRLLPDDEIGPSCDEILFDVHTEKAELLAAQERPQDAADALRQALLLRALPSVLWRRIALLRALGHEEEAHQLRLLLLQPQETEPRPNLFGFLQEKDLRQELIRFFGRPRVGPLQEQHRGLFTSPEAVLQWSYGEVRMPALYDKDDETPVFRGLLCPRIFGPSQDYQCTCGLYRGIRHRGIVCERCGVELTVASAREHRVGHIYLSSAVVHPRASLVRPGLLSTLLDIRHSEVERVLTRRRLLVVSSYNPRLWVGDTLDAAQLSMFQEQRPPGEIVAATGPEALERLLKDVDLYAMREDILAGLNSANTQRRRLALQRRLDMTEAMIALGVRAEHMFLWALPVLGPEYPLDAFGLLEQHRASLQRAYLNLIATNNMLRELLEENAPEETLVYWRLALQGETNNLFALFNTKRAEDT